MANDGFELSRRKILGSLGVIGAASAGAGMGTTAFLSDPESFENNTLTAGELDLRIDWQQTYRNGVAGSRDGADYVNAHPDHDDDGIQSLDSDAYDSVSDDGVVEYTDESRNIQEYLTCQTLDNHTQDDFGGQDHLIELGDVKPGDSGEITFSFHLCDNPGCVWLQGGNLVQAENGLTEPEALVDDSGGDPGQGNGELLENLRVRAWYDVDCDNVYEDGESLIFGWGSLDDFITQQLSGNGLRLNPINYPYADGVSPGGTSNSDGASSFDCLELGKLEFTGDDQDLVRLENDPEYSSYYDPDGDGDYAEHDDEDTPSVNNNDGDDDDDDVVDRRYKLSDGNEWAIIDITGFKRKDEGEVIGFYWEVDDASNDDLGICRVDVKGGGGRQGSADATNSYVFEPLCIQDTQQSGGALMAPMFDGKQTAVSNAVFYYCDAAPPKIPCFPGETTFCVGFEWFLPASVGNEIQGDSVAFDLGFYAEQARHNDNPGGS